MITRISRRTLMALTGGAALGAGSMGWAVAHAQSGTSPFTFAGGQVLTWTDPWTFNPTNQVTRIVPDVVALRGGNLGEVLFGYLDAPQAIDDLANLLLTMLIGDPALAQVVAGGGEQVVAADGTEASQEYRVIHLTLEEEAWGLYLELIDGTALGAFAAPVAVYAAEMESAQASVQIDGVGVFGGSDGAEAQQFLEEAAASAATTGGEYVDASGFVQVVWTNGWTEVERDDEGITLTNPAASMQLFIAGYPLDGKSWQEMADEDVAFLYDDQGASASLYGPTVTDSGHSFVTDGAYGLRFAQGVATDNPDLYVLVFAANFPAGIDPSDAVLLVQEAQAAVTVNGTPVLLGVEDML